MRNSFKILLLALWASAVLSGCATTVKIVPEYESYKGQALGEDAPTLSIRIENLPADDAMKLVEVVAGKGFPLSSNISALETQLLSAFTAIASRKGYRVVSSHASADQTLVVNFESFEVLWIEGFIISNGEADFAISHRLMEYHSNKTAWTYRRAADLEFGGGQGLCVLLCAAYTIIGIIPYMILERITGSPITQISGWLNEEMRSYLIEFEQRLPKAKSASANFGADKVGSSETSGNIDDIDDIDDIDELDDIDEIEGLAGPEDEALGF